MPFWSFSEVVKITFSGSRIQSMVHLGIPLDPLGAPLVSLGITLGPLGITLAPTWIPLGPSGIPLGPLGTPLGPLGTPEEALGNHLETLMSPWDPLGYQLEILQYYKILHIQYNCMIAFINFFIHPFIIQPTATLHSTTPSSAHS